MVKLQVFLLGSVILHHLSGTNCLVLSFASSSKVLLFLLMASMLLREVLQFFESVSDLNWDTANFKGIL